MADPHTALGLVMHGGELHVEHANVYEAPVVLITEVTAHRRGGLGKNEDDGAKTLRQWCKRGLPSVPSREGRVVLLTDLVQFVREHAEVMPAEPARAKPVDPETEARRTRLRGAGATLRSVGGRR